MTEQLKAAYYLYLRGARCNRKIVVFESDDWGTIRMPVGVNLESIIDAKICDFKNPFTRVDTLECAEDIKALCSVLLQYRGINNTRPYFVVNTVMANPDFDKIRKSAYTDYFYERFTTTYLRYGYNTAWEAFREAIDLKCFMPQFHAREHVNVHFWLNLLRNQDPEVLKAFNSQTFGLDFKKSIALNRNIMAAYDYSGQIDQKSTVDSILDGLRLFHEYFAFASKTAIAPIGLWDESHEVALMEGGVLGLQSFVIQRHPRACIAAKTYRFLGERNEVGQTYLPRNCYFEPSTEPGVNWIDVCLKQMARAFFFNKPAIISTHRLNYVSGVSLANRESGLNALSSLLSAMLKKWPDIEFSDSAKLLCEEFS